MNELENYVTEWNQWTQGKGPKTLSIFQKQVHVPDSALKSSGPW